MSDLKIVSFNSLGGRKSRKNGSKHLGVSGDNKGKGERILNLKQTDRPYISYFIFYLMKIKDQGNYPKWTISWYFTALDSVLEIRFFAKGAIMHKISRLRLRQNVCYKKN